MRASTSEHESPARPGAEPDKRVRRANLRLALVLGLVALAFYLGMFLFSPL